MRLRASCDLMFDITVSTPFIPMLRPRSGANQWVVREEYNIELIVPVFEFSDGYGNLCQRLVAPPGTFWVRTVAELMVADGVDRTPGAHSKRSTCATASLTLQRQHRIESGGAAGGQDA